ncbi:MAG: adenylyltransferase/cytidyltransferase family protein [Oricola sp.]
MTVRTVFTDGVFDLLHANHVAFLEEARGFGDRLIVGVISDRRVADYKRWPVMRQDERLAAVRGLACVDEVFLLDEPMNGATMSGLIEKYALAGVVYAGNATPDFYGPAEQAGIMHRIPYRDGVNTSEIIERIISRRQAGTL